MKELRPLQDGKTHACAAASLGYAGILTVLHSHGVDLEQPSVDGTMPLHYAALGLHVAAARCLVKTEAVYLDASPKDGPHAGLSALHIAAGLPGGVEMITMLGSHGADVDQTTPITRATPAFVGARLGLVDNVGALAGVGADLTIAGPFNVPVSMVAAHAGHVGVLRVLREAGVDLRQTLGDDTDDGLGETALAAAAACDVGGKGEFVVSMQRTLEEVERKIFDADMIAEEEHDTSQKNSPNTRTTNPPQLPSRWKVTAAKIAEKFGHKAALSEIVETNAAKIHAEIEKKKKKAARRRALGY